ncbi:MAG: hypothetical protein E6G36_06065 [Actinobacteria bacterium]|nr:MAG: hypothetical protein E6G36_06065 [Actinomycetota bacterium]
MGADPEADRHGGERVRARFQGTLSLVGRLTADVDARDANAVGEPARRPGEGKAQHQRGRRDQRSQGGGPLPEDAALRAGTAPAARPDQHRSTPGRQGVEV